MGEAGGVSVAQVGSGGGVIMKEKMGEVVEAGLQGTSEATWRALALTLRAVGSPGKQEALGRLDSMCILDRSPSCCGGDGLEQERDGQGRVEGRGLLH